MQTDLSMSYGFHAGLVELASSSYIGEVIACGQHESIVFDSEWRSCMKHKSQELHNIYTAY